MKIEFKWFLSNLLIVNVCDSGKDFLFVIEHCKVF